MNQAAARYFHASNFLTFVSVLAGLCAVFASHSLQSWAVPGVLLAICALADTFTGKFASFFWRSESLKDFGSQFDSLTDALSFGLVPVVCLLQLLTFESATEFLVWSTLAFFYVISAITRLGDHNLHHKERVGYVGLPTTIAALIWSSAFLVQPSVAVSAVLLLAIGIAMVSKISLPRPNAWVMFALLMWAVLLIALHGVTLWS